MGHITTALRVHRNSNTFLLNMDSSNYSMCSNLEVCVLIHSIYIEEHRFDGTRVYSVGVSIRIDSAVIMVDVMTSSHLVPKENRTAQEYSIYAWNVLKNTLHGIEQLQCIQR